MFEQVTLVQLSITNLAELLASVPAADLLVTVASLFHDLDTLLEQHGCYLLEGLDHSFTIVSGERGELLWSGRGLIPRGLARNAHCKTVMLVVTLPGSQLFTATIDTVSVPLRCPPCMVSWCNRSSFPSIPFRPMPVQAWTPRATRCFTLWAWRARCCQLPTPSRWARASRSCC